jgi:hypothetical protein
MIRFILIFAFLSFNYLSFSQDVNVLDYYKLYQKKFKTPELTIKNDKWTLDPSHKRDINVIVDVKNYFIGISYNDETPGTQGMGIRIKFAVFLKPDKSFLLVCTNQGIQMEDVDSFSYINFYEYQNNNFIDVTSEILPFINYRNFLDEKADPGRFKNLKEEKIFYNNQKSANALPLIYEIPQIGSTVIVRINKDAVSSSFVFDNGMISDSDRKSLDYIDSVLKYGKIEINWIYKKGVFEIGNKIPAGD